MFLTPNIERAIVRAAELHQEQRRRVSRAPFVVHPFAVTFLLAHYVDDEDVIIAGLLHDTLEDVPGYTKDMLREEFGKRVCTIVQEVSEDFTEAEKENQNLRNENWRARKEGYLKGLTTCSTEALLVATADKIHNIRGIIDEYHIHGTAFWKKFGRSSVDIFWFYTKTADTIMDRLSHPLVEEMKRTLFELRDLLKEE